ncbi:MAG: hypothetical protein ACE5NL_00815 [Candidatus Hydrothermarchaeaceae archaeon]
MRCQLCGYEFRKNEKKCRTCPMGECSMVCCPNCGYQFPEESKVINFIRNIIRRE